MMSYLEYLNLPATIGISIVGAFLIMQVVGEVLEFKGKVVPEFVKVRKIFARKKQERETVAEMRDLLRDFNSHYNEDNIRMRDEWIRGVNEKLAQHDIWASEISKQLEQNNKDTLSLLIESKRGAIIDFASFVSDESNSVTREQFNRIFRLYSEYEAIIEANGLTNGEVNIASRIIEESYENHMRNHSFVEDAMGYVSA